MQKLSETVYSSLFWLISGLMVWLLIVPVSLICFPVIILIKAAGSLLFKTQLNLIETERKSQTNSESEPANAIESLLTLLLVTTLIEVPALLAAVISLQPTRAIKVEQVHAQTLQSKPPKAHEKVSKDTIEIPTEEKISRN